MTPWSLASYINPTVITGDIYHRYWQEQFQIAGTIAANNGTSDGSNDTANGSNSGFVTWSDDPGLVMSHFDATNLPEGILAQQYTLCDNFYHSAFGGSFLNHQFLIAAAAPVYYNMPTSNNNNIAFLDSKGVFVMNTNTSTDSSNAKYVRDGSITPLVGDQISVVVNGTPATVTLTAANATAYKGGTLDKHYVVNTTRSVSLRSVVRRECSFLLPPTFLIP